MSSNPNDEEETIENSQHCRECGQPILWKLVPAPSPNRFSKKDGMPLFQVRTHCPSRTSRFDHFGHDWADVADPSVTTLQGWLEVFVEDGVPLNLLEAPSLPNFPTATASYRDPFCPKCGRVRLEKAPACECGCTLPPFIVLTEMQDDES